MSEKGTKYVSDLAVYHDGKRYAPGTELPAAAVKGLREHQYREATKADLKEAEEAEEAAEEPTTEAPPANPDAEEGNA
jgi:hypothetical protein